MLKIENIINKPNPNTIKLYDGFIEICREVIQRCLDIIVSAQGERSREKEVCLGLLREIMERIDGMIILAGNHSEQNIDVLGRSLLEAFLDLNFILKNPKRAIAYDYCKRVEYRYKFKKHFKSNLNEEELQEVKSLERILGEEFKKEIIKIKKRTKLKDKEKVRARLDWRNFYYDPQKDDRYKDCKGAKMQYDFLSAETHNQTSVINNYRDDEGFKFRTLRLTTGKTLGSMSYMIAYYSGDIFLKLIDLYCTDSPFEIETWWGKIIEESERQVKFNKKRREEMVMTAVSLSDVDEVKSTS